MINKQTTLELNGPNISFTQQPQPVTINTSGSATFTAVATATFPVQNPPNPATGTGFISYQWYEISFGALSNESNSTLQATISGSGTNALTISNATRNNLRFYVVADYVPSAYSQPPGSVVNVGTARSTGNATNEPITSNTAILTIRPLIFVTQNPSSASVAGNTRANFSAGGSSNDGTPVSYRWQLNSSDIFDSGNISGSGTPNLSVSLPNVSNNNVRARISHPTASNSPIFTNSANFTVVDPRQIINFESYRGNGTIIAPGFGSVNLLDGPFTNIADGSSPNRILSIYAAERDLPVRITMAGAAGLSKVRNSAGQGGVSVFEIIMKQNIEYIIRLGSLTAPSGGANGGGGGSFLYERSRIIAVCGGGGAAGESSSGGNGGGINVVGSGGAGRNSGIGGAFFAPGTLPASGFFAGGLLTGDPYNGRTTGGRVSGCAYGSFWFNTGLSPCQNFPGLSEAKTASVSGVFGTAIINRGFKPGELGYRINGGNGSGDDGGGGSGAVGGGAATGGFGGGGAGGSGYHDGSINLISTQSGGNNSTDGYLIIQGLI